MRKVIVAVAPVAQEAVPEVRNPSTPEDVAAVVLACAEIGASHVHLHVRDRMGRPTEDLTEFARTVDLIKAGSNIIVQGSTGGISDLSLEERCVSLGDPRVETASLNMGSANFGEGVYINTLPDIRFWAARMRERGVQPELAVFEGGMVNNTLLLAEEGYLAPPFVFGLCLGFRGALPANAYNLEFLRGMLPPGSRWGLIHHGMQDLALLATAIGMGATFVRVGFEDSCYPAPGRPAPTNVELVRAVTALVRGMGCEVADPTEARQILGLI